MPEPSQIEQIAQRAAILDALLQAVGRHVECADVIATSADASEARRRIQDLLGVSEIAATEVLNMQWRRLTREACDDLQARRDELQATRDALVGVESRKEDGSPGGDSDLPA